MGRPQQIVDVVRAACGALDGPLPLHAPVFGGNESRYVQSTIESTFVSSVGAFVDRFEAMLAEATSAGHAVACVNGTTALQMALLLAGVAAGDLVLTQSLSFVGTANGIRHAGGEPVFLDVDRETLGLSPDALAAFLDGECEWMAGGCRHRATGRRVAACMPMHSFGFPVRMAEIEAVCARWSIPVVEDAAEALGSRYRGRGCGSFGRLAALSFNGNKICTTGGGGAILTSDPALARRAKHLTTTAKVPHRWLFQHDEVGWNYRLPNLNAALGCAQLERLDEFVRFKRAQAERYAAAFSAVGVEFLREPADSEANYWLCAILAVSRAERDAILQATNDAGVMTRPVWEPLHTLPPYRDAPRGALPVTLDLADRLVNVPSSFREAA